MEFETHSKVKAALAHNKICVSNWCSSTAPATIHTALYRKLFDTISTDENIEIGCNSFGNQCVQFLYQTH